MSICFWLRTKPELSKNCITFLHMVIMIIPIRAHSQTRTDDYWVCNPAHLPLCYVSISRGGESRTHYLLLIRQTRLPLTPHLDIFCSHGQIRTHKIPLLRRTRLSSYITMPYCTREETRTLNTYALNVVPLPIRPHEHYILFLFLNVSV